MKQLKDNEKTELDTAMAVLAPNDASMRRMSAFSHAENSHQHQWHTDPFVVADHILYWMMTGKMSDTMKEERRDREAL